MGDLRDLPPPPPSPILGPMSIGAERWDRAEEATQKIIRQIQPTGLSEERRRAVIDYVQRLIRGRLGCEVFPFGSAPLKTYLPDGDIDLTVFGGTSVEDTLVNDVASILEAEDKNRAAEFIVKDVHIIQAEVKLVKCIVQNIVVDISFNQLGGLCTLCFLEQVDRLIGKDHLFKRSIILVKAWCYYESRILGAHHGLISTYALETLVLYIFHLFHSTLNGPLAVLYRFLDYFSKFDWDNYCVSLTGPVHISSLPKIVAEKPENGGSDLLLGNDFLTYCTGMFSVPSRRLDTNSRTFPQKHLNIIDPLKENNNLGRSVSKGNFCRIRSAFTFGARKLGQILAQPEDHIAGELCKFFSNTLHRHGSRQRPDVQDPIPKSGDIGYIPAFSFSKTRSGLEGKSISDLKSANSVGINEEYRLNPVGSYYNGGHDIELLGIETTVGVVINGHQKSSTKVIDPTLLPENDGPVNRTPVIGHYFSSNAEEFATSRIRGLKVSNDTSDAVHRSDEEGSSPGHMEKPSGRDPECPEYWNLSDLSGDFDSQFQNLQCGWWWHEHSSSPPAFPLPPVLPSQFQGSWDGIWQFYDLKRNGFSNANGFILNPSFYHTNTFLIPGTIGADQPRPRGTGTYIPNANRPPYLKPFGGRGRNHGPVRFPQNNGHVVTPVQPKFQDRSSHEHSQTQFYDCGHGNHASSDFNKSGSPGGKLHSLVNSSVECGSVGHVPFGMPLPESTRQQMKSSCLLSKTSMQNLKLALLETKPVLGTNHDRVIAKSYHLKDEDFPPLSI
ncbi:uncharacterized protein LOC127788633 [Diospyros lotus]|uniref:uncharacterized protein LOC127788633 n=1 Tax=Diospyros lotus TaxID=55363 RepID=UPI00224F0327|nr:uncharacterized protein LOC127788633 [Diospyros lotus]